MSLTREEPAQVGLAGQLARFVVIGGFSAVVDYGVYQALLHLGLYASPAKAASFVCGTTTAYLLNRRYTFRAAGGRSRFAAFVALYAVTFFVNVGVNALMLRELPSVTFRVSVAWVIAQATATAINFVMLRAVVFRERVNAPGSACRAAGRRSNPACTSPTRSSAR